MIITREWIQEYIDISNITTADICKALNSIGLEVDSLNTIAIPNGVLIGKVTQKEKHTDADKLNICQVDLGDSSVQIVCGAKNVDVGQLVPVATVGTLLGEDFKIKEAKLRGVDSFGMICSSSEIGMPKMNDGILVLDNSIGELTIGKNLSEYPLLNDEVIEIELTANRGDCLSIYGVARELSAYFNIPFKNIEYKVVTNNKGIGQVFEVNYDTNCKSNLLYKAVDISEFKLNLLNNIRVSIIGKLKNTDIENAVTYTTHHTGVLLNVYTKSVASDVSSSLVSLKIKQDEDGFDIVSGKVPLSTIGIDAGSITTVSDEVIIEASYINPEDLSQKVFDKKKTTGEIYYNASRGSEPNLNFGVENIISLLSLNGSTVYNGSQDFIDEIPLNIITISLDRVNSIIGQELVKSDITKILTSLGFLIKLNNNETLTITIPPYRHDIKNIADITEEIVRIIGIDNIISKPLVFKELNNITNSSIKLDIKNEIRTKAISNSFFETLTYIFTNRELLEKYNFPVVDSKKDITNPIVNELNTFRTTLAINLVQAVSHNLKQNYKSIGLYEIGTKFDENRDESKSLSLIFSGDKEFELVKNSGKPEQIDIFEFANKIANIVGDIELTPMNKIENDFIHPYQNGNIILNNKNIGILYKLHPKVAQDFDVPSDTFLADIDFDSLGDDIILANNISKYQSSKRDLSIIAPKSLEYIEIKRVINSLDIKEIKQFNLVDIYSDEKLGDDESLTIKFVLQSEDKTMEENDINSIMNTILDELKEKLNIGIR
ncbi:MAG: phenylalanine--tRNA ligase subunit beta [Campylobacterota bacterium]|nr:phenylalanine--tRNA ligase subunit beta [Campylobacterota bacterium]